MARWMRIGAALLVAALAACGGGGGTKGGGGTANPGTKAPGWTVLVYLVADNDLEPFALDDLVEMSEVGSSGGVRLVAQVDRSPDYSRRDVVGLGDFAGTKRIVVNQGRAEVVQDLGEQDMASPETLASFIDWGVKTYPADRTMLVLWDHGASWLGFGVDETSGPGRLLRLGDIVQGVRDGVQRAGIPKLDLLGFDACLMASWEVAQGLKPYASYLLASEEVEPGHGWDYRAFAAARDDAALSAVELGKRVSDGFKAQAVAEGTAANVTLSLVDLGKLGPLETALTSLSQLAPQATSLARARQAALDFGRQPDPAKSFDMVDLGDLLAKGADAGSSFASVRSQLDAGLAEAVVYQVTGPATSTATGLAVWFPQTEEAYRKPSAQPYAQFGGIGPWRTFLEAYLAGGTPGGGGGVPTFSDVTAVSLTPALVLQGTVVNPEAAAAVTIDFGVPNPDGSVDVLGELEGLLEGTTARAAWDYTALRITQGATTERAYIEVARRGDLFVATVPFGYFLAGQTAGPYAFRQLVFDATGEILQDETFVVGESGAVGALSPAPGSTLCPTVLHLTEPSTWTGDWICAPSGVEFQATQPFELAFEDIGPGTRFFVALWVTNAALEGDFRADIGNRP